MKAVKKASIKKETDGRLSMSPKSKVSAEPAVTPKKRPLTPTKIKGENNKKIKLEQDLKVEPKAEESKATKNVKSGEESKQNNSSTKEKEKEKQSDAEQKKRDKGKEKVEEEESSHNHEDNKKEEKAPARVTRSSSVPEATSCDKSSATSLPLAEVSKTTKNTYTCPNCKKPVTLPANSSSSKFRYEK